MQGKIDLQNLHLAHSDWGMDLLARSLQGTLVLASSDWKKAEFFITFEEASCHFEKNGCKVGMGDTLGEIRIQPDQDPYLRMGGRLLSQDAVVPFEIEGKGSLEKDKKSFQLSADFFLTRHSSHLGMQFSQKDKETSHMELECQSLTEEVFNILQLSFPLFQWPICTMNGGKIEGKCVGALQHGKVQSMTFSQCVAENLSFSLPTQNLQGSWQYLAFSGTLDQNSKGDLQITSLDSSLQNASISLAGVEKFRLISASLGVESGEVLASSAEGVYDGIWGKIQVLEPGSSDFFT